MSCVWADMRELAHEHCRCVAQLLAMEPDKRPTATELLAMLEPAPPPGCLDVDDADELCEEYLCAICQQLVLDAHTVCQVSKTERCSQQSGLVSRTKHDAHTVCQFSKTKLSL